MTNQELQNLKNKFDIIGNDPALNSALEIAVAVAPTDLTALICGESGVGKENIPKIIHQHSLRRTGKYFAVTADGEEYRGITADAVAECKIKCGEIAEKDFDNFVAVNDYYRAKQYLFDMLARKPRTLKEAERKLREKKFMSESIRKSVALATEYGYISDERFAEDYVETGSRTKGAYRLKAELRKKGVSAEHIERALAELTKEDEDECALRLAAKRLKREPDEKDIERCFGRNGGIWKNIV